MFEGEVSPHPARFPAHGCIRGKLDLLVLRLPLGKSAASEQLCCLKHDSRKPDFPFVKLADFIDNNRDAIPYGLDHVRS